MRINNVSKWNYKPEMEMLLFFAQRMDELLFHHSTDSYRYPVLSIISLCDEFISIYENNSINNSNLNHIIEEFVERLAEDSVAINILSVEYKEGFLSNWQQWDARKKYENILFIRRKLGGKKYLNGVKELLKTNIEKNKEKRLVDRYSGILVRLLIDEGYNENYIYHNLHDVFFHKPVTGFSSFDEFMERFTFKRNQYDVYIGFSYDLSKLLPLFKKISFSDIDISSVDPNKLPAGIKKQRQKTILKFEKVPGLDYFSAYENVKRITTVIINSYNYYSHVRNKIKVFGQVIDEDSKVRVISEQDLLKNRVSALSLDETQRRSDKLLNITFTSYDNLDKISKITEIHNSAIYANDISDSLLSLWSIVESLSETDVDSKDKISIVKACMMPFLKSTYVEKIVNTCMLDIKRWNNTFFNTNIIEPNSKLNELEATFAFLVLDEMEEQRKELYAQCELFPLLRNRVFTLNAQLKNTKGYKSLLESHCKRVEWQLHRIYRARNYIIHDSRREDDFNMDLVVNLHSYVDLMFNKIVDLLIDSPYLHDHIGDVIIEHNLKTIVMDERLEKMQKNSMTSSSIKQFLYYDFEK